MASLKRISPEGNFLWQRISNNIQIAISGIVLLFLTTWITVDISVRAITGFPLPETVNLAEFIVGWVIFIPMAYTLFVGQHVRVSILSDKLRPRPRLALEIFTYFADLLFFGLAVYFSWIFWWRSFISNEITNPGVYFPWWMGKISLFIGVSFISAQCVMYLLDRISRILAGKE